MLQFLTYLFIAIYTATVIGIILVVILGNRNPLKTIPWVVVLIFAPVVGLVFYFFFGQDLRRKRIISRRTYKRLMVYALPAHVRRSDAPVPAACQSLSTLLTNTSQAVSFYGSRLTHYGDGASKMTALLEEIEKARDHIHILYYIFCDDETGARLQQALIRKAKEGVKVRVLYDDVGCNGVKKEFFQQMRDAGAEVHALLHVRFPMLTDRVNYRNHRKIVVIDGRIAYTGGVNLADEYINAEQRFGYWKDAALRVEGDAAWNFTVMFLNFWNAFRPSETDYDAFRPMPLVPPVSDGIVQPYADSPLDEEPMAETVYLNILAQAQQYIYIYTPYLAVGEEMLDALKNAAKRGVDIRLVLPGIPDKKLVFRLSRSYYLPLLRAGVRIYEYTPGFLHAKCWVSDDVTAVVGSINMDYRSLFLHFECGVLLQKNSQVAVLRDDVRATLPQCREIQVTECRTSLPGTVLDSVLRLLSPLM